MPKYQDVVLSEAQLEDHVRQAPDSLEPGLTFLANQVQTNFGRLDVLMADSGRALVVAELKVVQDDNMVAQGLDYYDYIVENRHALASFSHIGKFDVNQTPRLVLVAPAFSQLLLNRCRWLDLPISLIRYQAIHIEGIQGATVVYSEVLVPPRTESIEISSIETHLNYVTDEGLRNAAKDWITKLRDLVGASISLSATKSYISIKAHGKAVGELTAYRKKWLVSVRDADGQWQHIAANTLESFTEAVREIEGFALGN